MEINLHNYETYFLLWIDNELSIEETRAVAHFVEKHPELLEELNLLKETKIIDAESIVFKGKAGLLKSTEKDITINNFEEYFLLFIDDELSQTEHKKVAQFLVENPSAKASMQLLKQTKLPQEEWVFTQKNELYRAESTNKRVIFLWWKKLAIAAIFIGCIVMAWMLLPNRRDTINNNNVVNSNVPNPEKIKSKESAALVNSTSNSTTNTNPISIHKNQIIQKQNPVQTEIIAASNENDTRKQLSLTEIITINQVQLESSASVIIEKELKTPTFIITQSSLMQTESDAESNNITEKEVYKELDIDERDNNIYVGSMSINKDKFRGLIRRASSFLKVHSKQTDAEVDADK